MYPYSYLKTKEGGEAASNAKCYFTLHYESLRQSDAAGSVALRGQLISAWRSLIQSAQQESQVPAPFLVEAHLKLTASRPNGPRFSPESFRWLRSQVPSLTASVATFLEAFRPTTRAEGVHEASSWRPRWGAGGGTGAIL